MKKAITEKDWLALKHAAHALIPTTFVTISMPPEFEAMTKSIQVLTDTVLTCRAGASQDTTIKLLSPFLKIEIVCALAAWELEAKLLMLSKAVSGVRETE